MSVEIREPGPGNREPGAGPSTLRQAQDRPEQSRGTTSSGPPRAESRGGSPEPDKSPRRIAGMFDAIAARYDLLNTVLSGGLDRYWRRKAIASLQLTGHERLLDVCTGTADVAIGSARRGAGRVVGVDFSGAMLAHAVVKVRHVALVERIQLIRGDAMNLPVSSGSVDAATIAFGIRNVQRPEVACAELFRALRPGAASRSSNSARPNRRCSVPSITGIRAISCRTSAVSSRATTPPTRTCLSRSAPSRTERNSTESSALQDFHRFGPGR